MPQIAVPRQTSPGAGHTCQIGQQLATWRQSLAASVAASSDDKPGARRSEPIARRNWQARSASLDGPVPLATPAAAKTATQGRDEGDRQSGQNRLSI